MFDYEGFHCSKDNASKLSSGSGRGHLYFLEHQAMLAAFFDRGAIERSREGPSRALFMAAPVLKQKEQFFDK
jgi:hypothetical protein